MSARSHLFVPGTRPDLMVKADRGPADVVVIDLEDAVPEARKDEAREHVARWFETPHPGQKPVSPVWVRANSGHHLSADLAALQPISTYLAGILLAKAEDPVTIAEVTALGTPVGLFLETAAAVLAAPTLASLPGVSVLHLGEYDLAAEVGLTPGEDDAELAWARAQVVFASAAAGLTPPPAPVSTVVTDTASFLDSTRRAARQGFVGRMCIHPAQIEPVHQVFTPTREQARAARELLTRYEEAEHAGVGVLLDDAGRMVDGAVIRSARRLLATAGAA